MAAPFVTSGPDENGNATVTFTEHYATPPRPPFTEQFERLVESAQRVHVDPNGYSLGTRWLMFVANVTERAAPSGTFVGIGPLTKHSETAADIRGLIKRVNIVTAADEVWSR